MGSATVSICDIVLKFCEFVNAPDQLQQRLANATHVQVAQLKEELHRRSIAFPSRANKAALLALCLEALPSTQDSQNDEDDRAEGQLKRESEVKVEVGAAERSAKVVPGTRGLAVATAAAAAEEKVEAGENRAVEHVALGDTDVAGNMLK